MNDRALSTLGMAQRAGKVVSGEELVLAAVRSRQAKIVLLAEDAAPGSHKKFTDKCRSYGVRLERFGTRAQLGRALGKHERVVVAVTDDGLARLVLAGMQKSSER